MDDVVTQSYPQGMMRTMTTITTKGHVLIPKPIWARLRWRSGIRLSVEVIKHNVVRLSASTGRAHDPIERAFGLLAGEDVLRALEAEHCAEIKLDNRGRSTSGGNRETDPATRR